MNRDKLAKLCNQYSNSLAIELFKCLQKEHEKLPEEAKVVEITIKAAEIFTVHVLRHFYINEPKELKSRIDSLSFEAQEILDSMIDPEIAH